MRIQQLARPVYTLANAHFTRAQALSLSLHIAFIALQLTPAAVRIVDPGPPGTPPKWNSRIFAPTNWLSEQGGKENRTKRDGGGGDRTNTVPTAGQLPPFDWRQLAPPRPVPPKDARLRIQPTLIGPPEIQPPATDHLNWGDPRLPLITLTAGPGSKDGVGRGCCGSVGNSQNGRGIDEDGGVGIPAAGTRRHGSPVCAYCPNPAFTDEAIRVRWQGTVILRALITPDGRPTNITVVRGAGMGLDENAIEKVKTWRLTPARGPDGRPAAVWTLIEVVFRQH